MGQRLAALSEEVSRSLAEVQSSEQAAHMKELRLAVEALRASAFTVRSARV